MIKAAIITFFFIQLTYQRIIDLKDLLCWFSVNQTLPSTLSVCQPSHSYMSDFIQSEHLTPSLALSKRVRSMPKRLYKFRIRFILFSFFFRLQKGFIWSEVAQKNWFNKSLSVFDNTKLHYQIFSNLSTQWIKPLQNRPLKGSTTCTSEITVSHPSGIHCPLCVDVFPSLHINCLFVCWRFCCWACVFYQ